MNDTATKTEMWDVLLEMGVSEQTLQVGEGSRP